MLLFHYPVLSCEFQALKDAGIQIFISENPSLFLFKINFITKINTFYSVLNERSKTQKESYYRLSLIKINAVVLKISNKGGDTMWSKMDILQRLRQQFLHFPSHILLSNNIHGSKRRFTLRFLPHIFHTRHYQALLQNFQALKDS